MRIDQILCGYQDSFEGESAESNGERPRLKASTEQQEMVESKDMLVMRVQQYEYDRTRIRLEWQDFDIELSKRARQGYWIPLIFPVSKLASWLRACFHIGPGWVILICSEDSKRQKDEDKYTDFELRP